MKIDQQTERHVKQLHVAQELRLVNRENLFHSLRFNQDAAFDKHVKTQRFLRVNPLYSIRTDF